jgi:hypothetical protein
MREQMLRHVQWFVVAGSVTSACAALVACTAPPVGEDVGSQSAAIEGGTPTTAFPAVGNLVVNTVAGYPLPYCTATLVAPDVILTAAHCVVRAEAAPSFLDFAPCRPKINESSRFVLSAAAGGAQYPIDVANSRVYVGGQSVGELLADNNPAWSTVTSLGMCGTARNANYYALHPWEDIAILGIAPSGGGLPNVPPMQAWTAPSGQVAGFLAGTFTWLGRAGGAATTSYAGSGLLRQSYLGDLCIGANTQLAPGGWNFFARVQACDGSNAVAGLLEGGDSGGAAAG